MLVDLLDVYNFVKFSRANDNMVAYYLGATVLLHQAPGFPRNNGTESPHHQNVLYGLSSSHEYERGFHEERRQFLSHADQHAQHRIWARFLLQEDFCDCFAIEVRSSRMVFNSFACASSLLCILSSCSCFNSSKSLSSLWCHGYKTNTWKPSAEVAIAKLVRENRREMIIVCFSDLRCELV